MDEMPKILVIDDDPFMQELFVEALGEKFAVVCADSGQQGLEMARSDPPAAILLDVDMPGLNGYETCVQLKDDFDTAGIPVIFVSGQDRLEDRLKGYESGGEDYVVKPFDAEELRAKISSLMRVVAERSSLKAMASYASSTAMTAMTSMSEMGALLEALKQFNQCQDYRQLGLAALQGLGLFGMQGVVQLRLPDAVLTLNPQGEASQLEASVIGHMRSMERIVQFKNRLCITYPQLSLLVNDMPIDDPDRCGRLRDHLAMLTEAAEVRLQAIGAASDNRRRAEALELTVKKISAMLAGIDAAQRDSRLASSIAVSDFLDAMKRAYLSVGLSDAQESFMEQVVTGGLTVIMNAQLAESDLQNRLSELIADLKQLAG